VLTHHRCPELTHRVLLEARAHDLLEGRALADHVVAVAAFEGSARPV
jgi:hypothetical protein